MKSDDRRTALIDLLADHVLAQGLAASSLRPLSKAAGVSDRMLLYYFKDKAEILTAVLARVAERLTILLNARTTQAQLPLDSLRRKLITILFAPDLWPYMRVWIEVAALSARGDPFYRAVGEQLGRGFLNWGAVQLDCPTDDARVRDAAQLLVSIEGLLFLRSVGLDDVCDAAF
jgi:AcrR family transcriptional regulator